MPHIDRLIAQAREFEEQARIEYAKTSGQFSAAVAAQRLRFTEEVLTLQRSRVGVLRFARLAPVLSWFVAPVIYSGIIPLAMLDLFLYVYQAINFGVYRIARVKRSDYVVLDRGDLPYLNVIERFNCFYCGYANGLMAYAREIAARTEQYFCPIKHARRILAAHERYPGFFEYGDAEAYRMGLERLRDALAETSATG